MKIPFNKKNLPVRRRRKCHRCERRRPIEQYFPYNQSGRVRYCAACAKILDEREANRGPLGTYKAASNKHAIEWIRLHMGYGYRETRDIIMAYQGWVAWCISRGMEVNINNIATIVWVEHTPRRYKMFSGLTKKMEEVFKKGSWTVRFSKGWLLQDAIRVRNGRKPGRKVKFYDEIKEPKDQ